MLKHIRCSNCLSRRKKSHELLSAVLVKHWEEQPRHRGDEYIGCTPYHMDPLKKVK